LAFEAPRISVIIVATLSPATTRASQRGRRRGGFAPAAAASAGRAALERGERRRGRVVDVDERPDAAAVADDREAALADQLDLVAARCQAGARPVEAAVAQRDAAGLRDGLLEAADRRERLAHRRHGVGVERVVLRLDRSPGAGVRPAGERLGDEAARAGLARAGEQVVGALRAEAVGEREGAVEVAQAGQVAERGELMDDRVGPRGGDRGDDRVAVQAVGDHRLGARGAQHVGLGGGAGGAGHLVARFEEQRYEPAADGARGACEEDAHLGFSFAVMNPETRWRRAM
jgi:hypothetical protein